MEVCKKEVEERLGCTITDGQFVDALRCAKRKQAYIYHAEHRDAVLEHWYLAMLVAEYARDNAFSRFTMDLCQELQDMEKEHQFDEHGAPTDNHILADSAL